MARYNAWQNKQLMDVLKGVDEAVLRKDQGAFFGSIMGTLNHLLWGDTIWMSRFVPSIPKPAGSIDESVDFTPTFAVWSADRFRLDGAILMWADTMGSLDLKGQLSWFSGALGRDVRKPLELCVTHMFNHQTHHRGQVHAMMTAAGLTAPVSDLFVMPEDM
ncbi:DinB family protein [Tateyamaria sp. SN6-1]|uniref:DinB family protein n=1 Tax=Tateyamaria sp. SN6-1 TaxID=3092148 RepID=UPI0039F50131